MTRTTGFVNLTLVLAVVAGIACSSDFEDCAANRSCAEASQAGEGGEGGGDARGGEGGEGARSAGKGGDGGNAGSNAGAGADGGSSGEGGLGDAGEGGTGSEPECVTDDDCDDGVHCNGVEQCADDVCQPGSEPCSNPDPAHCAITCAEGASAPTCGLEGLDQDGDSHLDAACSQAPGDDCDDSATDGVSIHPGADETCNGGVDDDCDGEDETTDEVVLSATSGVLVAPDGISRRDHPSIAAIPAVGGFGVVWADWRTDDTPHIYYRPLAADGTAGDELSLTADDPDYDSNDYPDLTAYQGEFLVGFRAEQTTGDLAVIRRLEVKFDGSASENPVNSVADAWADTGPQLSGAGSYLKLSTDVLLQCSAPNSCYGTGAAEPHADTFHLSATSLRLVYERAGDIYLREPNVDTAMVPEPVSENRSNPVVTEDAGGARLAYRYGSGIRIGSCELPDGIPLDLARTNDDQAVLLYSSPDQTALYVRVINSDCSIRVSALVASQDGNTLGSAALAVDENDENDVIAVVWASRLISTNEWSILHRIFSPALCE